MKALLLSVFVVLLLVTLTTQKSLYGNAVRQYCRWQCAEKGIALWCDSNEAMAGLCGSDNRENCDNPTYCPDRGTWHHALLCCSYRVVINDDSKAEEITPQLA